MQRGVGREPQRAIGKAPVGSKIEPLEPHRARSVQEIAGERGAFRRVDGEKGVAQIARQLLRDACGQFADGDDEIGVLCRRREQAGDVERVGVEGDGLPRRAGFQSQALHPAIRGDPKPRARASSCRAS